MTLRRSSNGRGGSPREPTPRHSAEHHTQRCRARRSVLRSTPSPSHGQGRVNRFGAQNAGHTGTRGPTSSGGSSAFSRTATTSRLGGQGVIRMDGVDDPRRERPDQMTDRDGGPRGGAHDRGGPAADPLTGVRRRVRASPWMGDVGPGRRWSAVPGVRRAARLQPRRRPDQAGRPAAVARPRAVRRGSPPYRRRPYRRSTQAPVRLRTPAPEARRWGRRAGSPRMLRRRRPHATGSGAGAGPATAPPASPQPTSSPAPSVPSPAPRPVAGSLHRVAGAVAHVARQPGADQHAVGFCRRGRAVGRCGRLGGSVMRGADG